MRPTMQDMTEAERLAHTARRRAHNRQQNRKLAVLIPVTMCLLAVLGIKEGAYSFSELVARPMVAVEWLDDEVWKPPTIECRHGCWPKFVKAAPYEDRISS